MVRVTFNWGHHPVSIMGILTAICNKWIGNWENIEQMESRRLLGKHYRFHILENFSIIYFAMKHYPATYFLGMSYLLWMITLKVINLISEGPNLSSCLCCLTPGFLLVKSQVSCAELALRLEVASHGRSALRRHGLRQSRSSINGKIIERTGGVSSYWCFSSRGYTI